MERTPSNLVEYGISLTPGGNSIPDKPIEGQFRKVLQFTNFGDYDAARQATIA
jgi:hypothetical protein